ncbi:MAG TPA: DUF2807 domain-containing protein [Bacteroidales bacterium]|nr:DUF2807 domain-containing protein [Bacteroidales bacterium]HOL74686.1 DUF2807 domain-containing protein [Bacteroidales bacterium]
MKTKFFTCIIAILISFSFANGQKIEKELGEIKKLNLNSGSYTLKRGDGKIIYYNANDGKLAMLYDSINKYLNMQTGSNVEIYLPAIDTINISEIAKLSVVDTIFTNNLNISVNEASMCDLIVNCDTLELFASEASYIRASGQCNYLKVKANEASYINAAKLVAKNADVFANEASGVSVNALDTLNITAQEVSYISYFGKPTNLNFTKDEFSFITNKDSININDTINIANKILQSLPDFDSLLNNLSEIKFKIDIPDTDTYDKDIINEDKNYDKRDNDKKDAKSDKKNKFKGHWAALDFLFTNYADKSLSYTLPANYDYFDLNFSKSTGVQLNFFQQSIPFNKSRTFGMVTGLGLQCVNYTFSQKPIITDSKQGLIAIIDSTKTVAKSKITADYLQLPVLFEYQAKSKPYFHISVGAIGGVMIGSHAKIKYSTPDKNEKERSINSLYPFKYGLVCRFGIKNLSFTLQYNFSPVFKENKGPEVLPLEFGITLLSF